MSRQSHIPRNKGKKQTSPVTKKVKVESHTGQTARASKQFAHGIMGKYGFSRSPYLGFMALIFKQGSMLDDEEHTPYTGPTEREWIIRLQMQLDSLQHAESRHMLTRRETIHRLERLIQRYSGMEAVQRRSPKTSESPIKFVQQNQQLAASAVDPYQRGQNERFIGNVKSGDTQPESRMKDTAASQMAGRSLPATHKAALQWTSDQEPVNKVQHRSKGTVNFDNKQGMPLVQPASRLYDTISPSFHQARRGNLQNSFDSPRVDQQLAAREFSLLHSGNRTGSRSLTASSTMKVPRATVARSSPEHADVIRYVEASKQAFEWIRELQGQTEEPRNGKQFLGSTFVTTQDKGSRRRQSLRLGAGPFTSTGSEASLSLLKSIKQRHSTVLDDQQHAGGNRVSSVSRYTGQARLQHRTIHEAQQSAEQAKGSLVSSAIPLQAAQTASPTPSPDALAEQTVAGSQVTIRQEAEQQSHKGTASEQTSGSGQARGSSKVAERRKRAKGNQSTPEASQQGLKPLVTDAMALSPIQGAQSQQTSSYTQGAVSSAQLDITHIQPTIHRQVTEPAAAMDQAASPDQQAVTRSETTIASPTLGKNTQSANVTASSSTGREPIGTNAMRELEESRNMTDGHAVSSSSHETRQAGENKSELVNVKVKGIRVPDRGLHTDQRSSLTRKNTLSAVQAAHMTTPVPLIMRSAAYINAISRMDRPSKRQSLAVRMQSIQGHEQGDIASQSHLEGKASLVRSSEEKRTLPPAKRAATDKVPQQSTRPMSRQQSADQSMGEELQQFKRSSVIAPEGWVPSPQFIHRNSAAMEHGVQAESGRGLQWLSQLSHPKIESKDAELRMLIQGKSSADTEKSPRPDLRQKWQAHRIGASLLSMGITAGKNHPGKLVTSRRTSRVLESDLPGLGDDAAFLTATGDARNRHVWSSGRSSKQASSRQSSEMIYLDQVSIDGASAKGFLQRSSSFRLTGDLVSSLQAGYPLLNRQGEIPQKINRSPIAAEPIQRAASRPGNQSNTVLLKRANRLTDTANQVSSVVRASVNSEVSGLKEIAFGRSANAMMPAAKRGISLPAPESSGKQKEPDTFSRRRDEHQSGKIPVSITLMNSSSRLSEESSKLTDSRKTPKVSQPYSQILHRSVQIEGDMHTQGAGESQEAAVTQGYMASRSEWNTSLSEHMFSKVSASLLGRNEETGEIPESGERKLWRSPRYTHPNEWRGASGAGEGSVEGLPGSQLGVLPVDSTSASSVNAVRRHTNVSRKDAEPLRHSERRSALQTKPPSIGYAGLKAGIGQQQAMADVFLQPEEGMQLAGGVAQADKKHGSVGTAKAVRRNVAAIDHPRVQRQPMLPSIIGGANAPSSRASSTAAAVGSRPQRVTQRDMTTLTARTGAGNAAPDVNAAASPDAAGRAGSSFARASAVHSAAASPAADMLQAAQISGGLGSSAAAYGNAAGSLFRAASQSAEQARGSGRSAAAMGAAPLAPMVQRQMLSHVPPIGTSASASAPIYGAPQPRPCRERARHQVQAHLSTVRSEPRPCREPARRQAQAHRSTVRSKPGRASNRHGVKPKRTDVRCAAIPDRAANRHVESASAPIYGAQQAPAVPRTGTASSPSAPINGAQRTLAVPRTGTVSSLSAPIYGAQKALAVPRTGTASSPSAPVYGAQRTPAVPRTGTSASASAPIYGAQQALAVPRTGTASSPSAPVYGAQQALAVPRTGTATSASAPIYGAQQSPTVPRTGTAADSSTVQRSLEHPRQQASAVELEHKSAPKPVSSPLADEPLEMDWLRTMSAAEVPSASAVPAAQQSPQLDMEQLQELMKQLPQPDIKKIADKVYREIEKRMKFERQRRGI
ncbi:hypothetical protein [Paenibacillus hexagrammi]|uniref:Uncharacterized protein n=1 Tax=Paenibacillus hexagrammi TaxID=2908839 RepID=A0ABY3SLS8_9BACL|nr:hypothetical protein [Paenibacillus sp. YPD9-1]UJF34075.1 hypothetical protein L0M14_02195 [Paenibacillus sp. YPD9-1]